mmetsp:Transcript_29672/g.40763  ORF Transcript_29672/g.40763 Transcript_29672/m.40763 type:complete len:309 (-) Transcript_29672:1167-2093(-)
MYHQKNHRYNPADNLVANLDGVQQETLHDNHHFSPPVIHLDNHLNSLQSSQSSNQADNQVSNLWYGAHQCNQPCSRVCDLPINPQLLLLKSQVISHRLIHRHNQPSSPPINQHCNLLLIQLSNLQGVLILDRRFNHHIFQQNNHLYNLYFIQPLDRVSNQKTFQQNNHRNTLHVNQYDYLHCSQPDDLLSNLLFNRVDSLLNLQVRSLEGSHPDNHLAFLPDSRRGNLIKIHLHSQEETQHRDHQSNLHENLYRILQRNRHINLFSYLQLNHLNNRCVNRRYNQPSSHLRILLVSQIVDHHLNHPRNL